MEKGLVMFLPLLVDGVVPEDPGPCETPVGVLLSSLLVAVAGGDQEAFAQLYDLTKTRIYSLVLRQVGPAEADVVTQQVYVALWRQAATFDPSSGHALAWVVSLAHHQLTIQHRVRLSRAGRPRVSPRRPSGGRPGSTGGAGGSGCCALTSHQQDILTLVYLGGYNHRQVAQLLGVSRPTVTTTVRAGLLRLTDELPAAS